MKGPTPQRLRKYLEQRLRLKGYLRHPREGRKRPQVPAGALLWAMLVGQLVRDSSAHAVEALVCSPARQALRTVIRQVKRKKAFDQSRFIGLAVDGSTAGRCREQGCARCRPSRNAQKEIVGYRHHFVLVSVAGVGLTLPLDVEPYGPSER